MYQAKKKKILNQ